MSTATTAKKRMQRNLNPRPPAVFAMYHWSADYAAQGGGTMDFFDSLHPADQKYCNDAVTAIVHACVAYGFRLVEAREPMPKTVPRLKKRKR